MAVAPPTKWRRRRLQNGGVAEQRGRGAHAQWKGKRGCLATSVATQLDACAERKGAICRVGAATLGAILEKGMTRRCGQ